MREDIRKEPPKWTGFAHKTLWNWLQLLIIPILLAVGAAWFNFTQEQTSRLSAQRQHDTDTQIALDRQRQEALITYQRDISDLLLTHHLLSSEEGNNARSVARARTLSTLRTLDSDRKGLLIQFLCEANLITTKNPVISLKEADLSRANFSEIDLSGANFSGAHLDEANFNDTAGTTTAQLEQAESLKGATMPNGSKHP